MAKKFQAKKFQIGIIGISGYTGLELVKLLLNHKFFDLSYVANSSGESSLYALYPNLINVAPNLPVQKIDFSAIKGLDLVFLALPHKESMSVVPRILELGVKVVDLSADYRLCAENYEAHYCKHSDLKNLSNAVYGLVEWNRKSIKGANLVANPGCYPTASLLGILPFIAHLGDFSIFIDAKSGVSGAGKKLTENSHYPQINENMFAYSPFTHRHSIEIKEKCEFFGRKIAESSTKKDLRGSIVDETQRVASETKQKSGLRSCEQGNRTNGFIDEANNKTRRSRSFFIQSPRFITTRQRDSAIKINFVPHLSPFTRGMLVSIFARLKEPLNPLEILRKCYKNEPFIRISENPVSVKNTAGSHFCDIFALCDGCDLFVSSSIDNLLRGASSQALACANLALGVDEIEGLPKIAYMP
ncbi:N-acetyl-gamma-glutamyl-phosphate reductase [Helicobacter sp. 23-1044]